MGYCIIMGICAALLGTLCGCTSATWPRPYIQTDNFLLKRIDTPHATIHLYTEHEWENIIRLSKEGDPRSKYILYLTMTHPQRLGGDDSDYRYLLVESVLDGDGYALCHLLRILKATGPNGDDWRVMGHSLSLFGSDYQGVIESLEFVREQLTLTLDDYDYEMSFFNDGPIAVRSEVKRPFPIRLCQGLPQRRKLHREAQ